MKLHCILIAVICLTCATVTAQVPQSERLSVDFYHSEEYKTLKEEILETTKQYYKARELRDRSKIDSLTHDDYQYIHDLNGYYLSKKEQSKLERKPQQKRLGGRGNKPIPGTVKVSPIHRDGAMLTMRSVYTNVRYLDGAVFDLGIVDQLLEFKKTDGRWQVVRHYSLDHHPDYNGNQADRVAVALDMEVLEQYVGTYEMSYDLYFKVSMGDDGLVLNWTSADNEVGAGPFDLFGESQTIFFREDEWVDWVYKFKNLEGGGMSLTILFNSQFFSYGKRLPE